jgi:hypothetical protein
MYVQGMEMGVLHVQKMLMYIKQGLRNMKLSAFLDSETLCCI